MSKYTGHIDGGKVFCPYCGDSYQPEAEDYSESRRSEVCSECGKLYWVSQLFQVEHETAPDCGLNGAQHQWKPVKFHGVYIHDVCQVCNQCRLAGGGDVDEED